MKWRITALLTTFLSGLLVSCNKGQDETPDLCATISYAPTVEVIQAPYDGEENGRIILRFDEPTSSLEFSLNDTLYQEVTTFSDLSPGAYTLYIRDQNDCKVAFPFVLSAIPTFSLTVNGGTGSGSYPAGSQIGIRAFEAPFATEFLEWTGDTGSLTSSTDASARVTMPPANIEVSASYDSIQYQLIVNRGEGDGYYPYQRLVAIAPEAPNVGEAFVQWLGDIRFLESPNQRSITFPMPAENMEVTASFQSIFQLTVIGGAGSGSYAAGSQVSLQALEGQQFVRWEGDVAGLDDPTLSQTAFAMPAQDIVIFGTYDVVSFSQVVFPIMELHCYYPGCHEGSQGEPKLSNHEEIALQAAGIDYQINACSMPPEGCLEPFKIDQIVKWIEAGTPNN